MPNPPLPRRLLHHAMIVTALLCAAACSQPIGPIPGGALSGKPGQPPDHWEFANAFDQIQLETQGEDGEPHSVNIWCGVVDGRLFVPTSLVRGAEEPEERHWVQNALRNGQARVQIDGQVYETRIQRITDEALIATVKDAMLHKYDASADARSANAWIFELANL